MNVVDGFDTSVVASGLPKRALENLAIPNRASLPVVGFATSVIVVVGFGIFVSVINLNLTS